MKKVLGTLTKVEQVIMVATFVIMVVYATITGASISEMFTSGMCIGIMIMITLMVVVLLLARKEKWPKAEKRPTLKEFGETFVKAIPAILLPVIIQDYLHQQNLQR